MNTSPSLKDRSPTAEGTRQVGNPIAEGTRQVGNLIAEGIQEGNLIAEGEMASPQRHGQRHTPNE